MVNPNHDLENGSTPHLDDAKVQQIVDGYESSATSTSDNSFFSISLDSSDFVTTAPPRFGSTDITLLHKAHVQMIKEKGKAAVWRHKLLIFLHQKWLHIFLTCLLVLDLILVIISLELQIQVELKTAEAYEYCYEAYNHGHAVPEYFDTPQCNTEDLLPCEPHELPVYQQAENIHHAERGLAWVSVSILSVFLLENILLILAMGFRFFKYVFFVFDFCIVIVSLTLELYGLLQNETFAVAGVLIAARIWRFIRVAHGIYFLDHESDVEGEEAEKKHKDKKKKLEELRLMKEKLKHYQEKAKEEFHLSGKHTTENPTKELPNTDKQTMTGQDHTNGENPKTLPPPNDTPLDHKQSQSNS